MITVGSLSRCPLCTLGNAVQELVKLDSLINGHVCVLLALGKGLIHSAGVLAPVTQPSNMRTLFLIRDFNLLGLFSTPQLHMQLCSCPGAHITLIDSTLIIREFQLALGSGDEPASTAVVDGRAYAAEGVGGDGAGGEDALDEGRVGGGDGVSWVGNFAGVVEEFGGFVLDLEDRLDGGEITEDVDEGCDTYERGREDELIKGIEFFTKRKGIEKRAREGDAYCVPCQW